MARSLIAGLSQVKYFDQYLTLSNHCRVPDTEWSFQDGVLYIVKKVGVKILTIIVLYSLS